METTKSIARDENSLGPFTPQIVKSCSLLREPSDIRQFLVIAFLEKCISEKKTDVQTQRASCKDARKRKPLPSKSNIATSSKIEKHDILN